IIVMLNPELMKHSLKSYRTEEGCLSLIGTRHVERYESVEVRYRDETFRKQRRKFCGITAQAIQHEMDHFLGHLI
ncbi:MAG: peptide deformylase, partial [Veillonellaceae bacterium]|nr:peptide deformylase [Veillonellaceae bacterium]